MVMMVVAPPARVLVMSGVEVAASSSGVRAGDAAGAAAVAGRGGVAVGVVGGGVVRMP